MNNRRKRIKEEGLKMPIRDASIDDFNYIIEDIDDIDLSFTLDRSYSVICNKSAKSFKSINDQSI